MQLARPRRQVTLLTALLVSLFAVGNAYADTRRISDGNDRPGPLDIRAASHGHAGVLWSTRSRRSARGGSASSARTRPTSSRSRSARTRIPPLSAWSLSSPRTAAWSRASSDCRNGRFLGSASASRPNARTVRVSILRSRLGNPVGYRWKAHSQYRAAGGCSRGCIDKAPNVGRVLHDITAPAIVLTSFPAIPADIEYDVSFTVSDTGGAGLRSWQLQYRPFGTPSWTTVDSGTTGGPKSYHHVSAEDNDDQFRVVAADRQGNSTVSPIRLVSVPVDDDALTYTGTWATGGTPDDFLGTLQSSSDANATASYSFNGQYVAWVAPGGGGMADVWVDGVLLGTVDLIAFSGPRRVVFQHTFASAGSRTILIDVLVGPVSVDGIIVR